MKKPQRSPEELAFRHAWTRSHGRVKGASRAWKRKQVKLPRVLPVKKAESLMVIEPPILQPTVRTQPVANAPYGVIAHVRSWFTGRR